MYLVHIIFQNFTPLFENSVDPDQLAYELMRPADQDPRCFYPQMIIIMDLQHWTGWKSDVDLDFTTQKQLTQ